MQEVRQLAPRKARAWLEADRVQLLDVREHWEHALAHLPGARLIPLGELPDRLGELIPAEPVLVYCHHGLRSWHASCMLMQCGFRDVANLTGGIEAWSREIEPAIQRY